MKASVAQINKAYWPHVGGVETVARQLAVGLARRGWRSSVLTTGSPHTEPSSPDPEVSVQRSRAYTTVGSLPLSPSLWRSIRTAKFDVLVDHEPSLYLPFALSTPGADRALRETPIVTWWHSDIVRQRKLERFYRRPFEELLSKSAAIIAATPNHVTSSSFLHPLRDRVHIIPFGIDLDLFDGETSAPLVERPSDTVFISVGRLASYKGLDRLIAAFDLLPSGELWIVGDGPLRADLERQAAATGKRIRFFGSVSTQVKIALLRSADVFVLASNQCSEQFGIVQIEAMSQGLPVVSFELPTGVTWVNQDGRTGLVARLDDVSDLAQKMGLLSSSSGLRSELGGHGRLRAHDRFSQERMVDDFVSVVSAVHTRQIAV